MLSINHTSTPIVRLALMRREMTEHKKILYITDISEDIFMMRSFARDIVGQDWRELTGLGEFWDMLEQNEGYYFCSSDILRYEGNLIHLERASSWDIVRGSTITEEECINKLIDLGYTHGDGTDTPGTYNKSGGTLTIRDALLERRVSCEWFDTELDSIILYEGDRRSHIAHIRMNKTPGSIVLTHSERLNPVLLDILRQSQEKGLHTIVSGCDFLEDKSSLLEITDIHMGGFVTALGISVDGSIPDIASLGEFSELLKQEQNIEIYTRYPRTVEDFLEYNSITGIVVHEVSSARLTSGMWTIDDTRHTLIADDILGQIFVKKRVKKSIAKHLDLLLSLNPGDYVVHREHGIALFHSVVKKTLGDIEREYIELHYAEGDKLFVPLTEIYRISRYIGENNPELTRLSGTEWERTIDKTNEEIEAIAQDILETSAKRSLAKGRAFGTFPLEEKKFQEAFAYEYTVDQKTAIDEIFADMESENPMDRLISGDVGFGKTEVAMNAIYKAVLSGTQVAVLSPLLVLADEHYETFCARLMPFGIRVGVLTRMSTPSEVKNTLDAIKNGTIDVVVGTHRLISDDVSWKRLGLLIIDEEHKFGVTHKEKIKKIKANLDILALSATPIPRSLNLALSGLRKISLLTTPPRLKKPIETIVTRWNEGVIREAIMRELERGGQIIIIHNRIRGMESIASEIEMIVNNPDRQPRIIITHGQMRAEDIEDRIHAFKKREYDILLTTTIIENGVNFLSANTIIIIDPEEFGLASLHQLRGRVGRKDIAGVCYLLYRKPTLAGDEKERLITIANNTHLGAGFEIAMRDMEIRGAGDVLGIKQAGKSKDVGLTLYFRMLEEKIAELKESRKARTWTKIELELSYVIPDDYFTSEADKLSFYREIENIETLEELEEIESEMMEKEVGVNLGIKDDKSKLGVRGEGTVRTKMITDKKEEQSEGEGVCLPLETFYTFSHKSMETGVGKVKKENGNIDSRLRGNDGDAGLLQSRGGQNQKTQNISNLFLLLSARILLSDYGVAKVSKVGMNYTFDFADGTDGNKIRSFLDRFDKRKNYVLLSMKKVRVETRYYRGVEDFLASLR